MAAIMTFSEVHEVHPDGDTLLILRHSGAAFATGGFEDEWLNDLPKYQTEVSKRCESSVMTKISQGDKYETVSDPSSLAQAKPEPLHLRFRLSSAVLIDTSSYFKKSLSDDWNTIESEPGYKWTPTETDWDGEAFLLLMNILHHKTRAVPRKIELEMLAKVAVLVDYYGCHEVVEPWVEIWMSNSYFATVESFYSRTLLLKLMISWVFSNRQVFRAVTEVAIRTSRGPIHTLVLPIPKAVVDAIEEVRISSIRFVIEGIERLWSRLNRVGDKRYGRQCLYMQLGYIHQSLSEIGLKPLPGEPYHGFSLEALKGAINSFDTSIKCSCWSWSWSRNHLQDLKLELQSLSEEAFRYSEDGVGISQIEGD